MSFRPQAKEPVVVNGDMSGNITSKVSIIPKLSMNTYSYSWSGSSPVGTVIVQLSNDYTVDAEGNAANAGTWNTVPFTNSSGATVTSFAVSGNTGTGFLEVTTGAYAIRTVYTAGSGTGTLQVVYNSKVT